MMRKTTLLILCLFSGYLLSAQPSQLQQAKNSVGKLQASITNKEDRKKQLAIIIEGQKAIDFAKKNKKTKNWADTWAINAYLNAYRSLIVEGQEDAEKYYQIALAAIDTAKIMDKGLSNSPLVNAAIHNIYIRKLDKGNNAFKESDYGTSYQILKDVSEYYPKDTTIALNVAIAAQYIQQNEEALKYFKRAKDNGIINAGVYQNLATIYAAKLETELAIKTLEDGIAVNPGNTMLKNDYINMLLDNEKYDKALEAVKGELSGNQANERLFYIYGFLLQHQNDPVKAEAAYKRAIALNQYFFDAFYQLGLVYLDNANKGLKKPDSKTEFTTNLVKAENVLKKAYDINPNDKPTISLLIDIYKHQKQEDRVRFLERKLREF